MTFSWIGCLVVGGGWSNGIIEIGVLILIMDRFILSPKPRTNARQIAKPTKQRIIIPLLPVVDWGDRESILINLHGNDPRLQDAMQSKWGHPPFSGLLN